MIFNPFLEWVRKRDLLTYVPKKISISLRNCSNVRYVVSVMGITLHTLLTKKKHMNECLSSLLPSSLFFRAQFNMNQYIYGKPKWTTTHNHEKKEQRKGKWEMESANKTERKTFFFLWGWVSKCVLYVNTYWNGKKAIMALKMWCVYHTHAKLFLLRKIASQS